MTSITTLPTVSTPTRADAGRAGPVLSESRLLPLLHRDPHLALQDPHAGLLAPVTLGADAVHRLGQHWRARIAVAAKTMFKHSRATLKGLPSGGLYEHLDDPRWQSAALVCELFRSPDLCKNAGWLATRPLQQRLVAALAGDAPLHFEIAWGQAKRDVGGLKLMGPLPDLAECRAIARLGTLVEAIERLLDGKRRVTLTILGGAQRFNDALFTRPALAQAYDDQRARLAEWLMQRPAIAVQPFVPPQPLPEAAEVGVPDHEVELHFPTIALNIDWARFFTCGTPDAAVPALPADVHHWLQAHGADDAQRLLRAAVTSTVNPRCRAAWGQTFGGAETGVLDAAIAFVRNTAWRSTRQYLRTQAWVRGQPRATGDTTIRLTVHEKRDRQDIPALYTLGPHGGDQLPQHVIARLGRTGTLRFGPLAQFQRAGALRPVLIATPPQRPAPLDWLAETGQPLCVADPQAECLEELLAKAIR
jgi:hypothetical protein